MPVKRRYRKNRAKRSRRMMRRKRKTGADGVYLEKLTSEVEFVSGVAGGPANTYAAMQLHWNRTINNVGGQNTLVTPAATNTFNVQFNQLQPVFLEYKVTGLKIEYRPYDYDPNPTINTITMVKGISCGTYMNYSGAALPNPLPLVNWRGAKDFKVYDSNKPFKRYYNVNKWNRLNDIAWRETADAITNTYAWDYADCTTCIQADTIGLPGVPLGVFKITYYCLFKSRRSI